MLLSCTSRINPTPSFSVARRVPPFLSFLHYGLVAREVSDLLEGAPHHAAREGVETELQPSRQLLLGGVNDDRDRPSNRLGNKGSEMVNKLVDEWKGDEQVLEHRDIISLSDYFRALL